MQRIPIWRLLACTLIGLSSLQAHEPHHQADVSQAFGAVMPRISDDGQWVAFSYQGAVWKMPSRGGPMTRLSHETGFDVEPAWSSDGKRIAYIASPSFGSGRLVVINAQTGKPMNLPSDLVVMDKLHFDRTNRRILGMFQPPNEKVRLAWLDLMSGELVAAVEPGSWPGHAPGVAGVMRARVALSHNNEWLAVTATADEPDEQSGNRGPRTGLWRVPLGGGKPTLIVQWPARIHDLCWRADDQGVLVATERGGVHHDLWEIPLENSDAAARKLTFGQADESNPSVSADGRWLLYSDNYAGATILKLRDLPEGTERNIGFTQQEFGAASGWLEVRTTEDGAPTTARLVIRQRNGKFFAPPGALYRILGSDLHFYLYDYQKLELPAGEYDITAARGPEHRAARQSITLKSGETVSVTLKLERWTNQRAAGWVSGENHIHANYGYGHWYNSPATMRQQCEGEDLIVANFMVANSDGDGVFDREYFLGRPDPLSTDKTILYWNEEFRSTIWGHMTLLNLKFLVAPIYTGFEHTTHPHDIPTNADIADHTHAQDGHVNYTHPAHNLQDPYASAYSAKEMPVDVALGKIDSIDVMGSNHQATYPVWYRLLNCGLHVPASAGTDCFLNRIVSRLPGSDRVYVHCPEKFTYQDWIAQLRAGHTFVTNGPMLRFAVDGQEAGSTLKFARPGEVRVVGSVEAQFPLEKLEVIVNGQVAATSAAEQGQQQISLDQKVSLERSGWIALRAKGKRGPSQSAAEAFAHTSPVYVEIEGHPVRSPEDAEYFVRWIQRLLEDVRKRNRVPAFQQDHVAQQLEQAIEFYQRLAAAK